MSTSCASVAEEVDREFRDALRLQAERAENLCRLRQSARNLETIQLALNAETVERLQADYHERALRWHAEAVASVLGGDTDTAKGGKGYDDTPLELGQPPEHNSLYWPSVNSVSGKTVRIRVGTAEVSCDAASLSGISEAIFAKVQIERFGASA